MRSSELNLPNVHSAQSESSSCLAASVPRFVRYFPVSHNRQLAEALRLAIFPASQMTQTASDVAPTLLEALPATLRDSRVRW